MPLVASSTVYPCLRSIRAVKARTAGSSSTSSTVSVPRGAVRLAPIEAAAALPCSAREIDFDARPLANLTVQLDTAAVLFDNAVAGCQS